MGRLIKIVLLVILISLVLLAALADFPPIATMLDVLHLPLYLRLISLLGLLIALLMAWGYKNRFITSQKYRQADQILAEAQASAKRKERATMLLEEKLKTQYSHQKQLLQEQMDRLTAEHQKQLMVLKTQNVQLKEAVSKLMRALKKNSRPDSG